MAHETVSNVDGISIRTIGKSDTTILFVHGYVCDSHDWDNQIDHLCGTYRCAALDLPGHGRSSAGIEPTMAAAGAAVNLAKRHLGGRVVLVGHSLGCKTIREAYRQDPTDVAGLAFIDGSLYLGRGDNISRTAHAAVEANGIEAYLETLVGNMFAADADPAVVERVATRARRVAPDFARRLFLDSVAWDVELSTRTIRDIEVAALVVQCMAFDTSFRWHSIAPGQQTPFMSVVNSLVPRSRVLTLPGSGHFPMYDVPDRLNMILDEFLQEMI